MNLITLALPSFRSKLISILKVLLAEVVAFWLNGNHRALTDGNVLDVIILTSNSGEYASSWSIVPGSFILYPINIGEFLQILVSDVCICLDYGVDLFPKFFVYLRIFS
jgi:hypothetical protein